MFIFVRGREVYNQRDWRIVRGLRRSMMILKIKYF
jgi:hypothetical protein